MWVSMSDWCTCDSTNEVFTISNIIAQNMKIKNDDIIVVEYIEIECIEP